MELTFVGTGAADWKEENRGEPHFRRFSSVQLNGDLLIDPGPHVFWFTEDFHCPGQFSGVQNCLLTHSHSDHFSMQTMEALCMKSGAALWCHAHAMDRQTPFDGLVQKTLTPYTPTSVGRYTVTALPANHSTGTAQEQALHFIIEDGSVRIFYGCDGAWLLRDSWYYLRQQQFDLMIFDGTLGDGYGDRRIFEHNNLRMVELLAEAMRENGVLKPDGRMIISHLSCLAHTSHAQVEQRLKESGIGVAFDALKLTV